MEKRRITVPETEPITHVFECEGGNQRNLIVFCTLNGAVYFINHQIKSLILKVNLNEPAPETPNIIYWMGPYSNFCHEKNPLLVIHDSQNGLYLLDLAASAKTFVVPKAKAKHFDREWIVKRGDQDSSQSSSDTGSSSEDEGVKDDWASHRYRNCSSCPMPSTPSYCGVTILHQSR